jgi:hypothetical protein
MMRRVIAASFVTARLGAAFFVGLRCAVAGFFGAGLFAGAGERVATR